MSSSESRQLSCLQGILANAKARQDFLDNNIPNLSPLEIDRNIQSIQCDINYVNKAMDIIDSSLN